MPFAKRAVVDDRAPRSRARSTSRGTVAVRAAPFGRGRVCCSTPAGGRARSSATRPFRDWHLARIEGQGQLVGTLLNVENPPGAAWWGEGDEKIYVDGERFPSLFGTGTEDYFGYAWSTPERFAHAYHAQTRAPARLRRRCSR